MVIQILLKIPILVATWVDCRWSPRSRPVGEANLAPMVETVCMQVADDGADDDGDPGPLVCADLFPC